jgi:hypothetical protein
MSTIYLIGCALQKRAGTHLAIDLYTSVRFNKIKKLLSLLKNDDDKVFILSINYGLIAPEALVDPYNKTMSDLSPAQRKVWAYDVVANLRASNLCCYDKVVLFASAVYFKPILPILRESRVEVSTPFQGLGSGEVLHFLNHEILSLEQRSLLDVE